MDIMNISSEMPHKRYSDMQVSNYPPSVALTEFFLPEIPGLVYLEELAPKCPPSLTSQVNHDLYRSILPGLPDDVAKHCLALVPPSCVPSVGAVSTKWRSFVRSNEFRTVRRLAGALDELIYMLVADDYGRSYWEVRDCLGEKHHRLPPMPGPVKNSFSVVGLNGKLLVIGGNFIDNGRSTASPDTYQYDYSLNSWSKLADMSVPRYDFACAEMNGKVYAVGGYGIYNKCITSAEVYDPDRDEWNTIQSLRKPRYGCFAYGFAGNLYVMGGRSRFSIGNYKKVEVYNAGSNTWCGMKNGCAMVITHAKLGNQMFCIEWKNSRKLTVLNFEDNSWKTIPMPVSGSALVGFRFGIIDGKLLLFPINRDDRGCRTLMYNPNAPPGTEWGTSESKPSGLFLCSVTVEASHSIYSA